jgi:hypothetical protein
MDRTFTVLDLARHCSSVSIYAALFVVAAALPVRAEWSTRERAPGDGPGTTPIALTSQTSANAEVSLAADDTIWLSIILARDAGNGFTAACPTVQVDRRLPLLFPPVGHGCVVTPHKAAVRIGQRTDRDVRSPMVYNLVNGTVLAVRYQSREERYIELTFPLSRSKQAVKAALGDYRIEPK